MTVRRWRVSTTVSAPAQYTRRIGSFDKMLLDIAHQGRTTVNALAHLLLPDMDIIDPKSRSAAVTALILHDLAKRAERHGDPYENLEAMYHVAEVSWASGHYGLTKDPGAR